MFEQSLIAPGKAGRERMIFLALGLQTVALGILLVIPLMVVQRIEAEKRFLLTPPSILTEKPIPVEAVQHATARPGPRVLTLMPAHAPVFTVPHVGPLEPGDAPPIAFSSPGEVGTGTLVLAGDFGGVPGPPAAQVVQPVKPKEPQKPVHVSTGVSQSQLEFGPKPAYPQLAIISRTEGTVRLQAIISRAGRIENLHVISGNPLLVPAALAAVKQWRYRPLLLNGEPVEVITEIEVNFTLNH